MSTINLRCWLSYFSWLKCERYDNLWHNVGLLFDADDIFHKINLVYETSVFTLALLTFQQPVHRTFKIIILLMANTQLKASLDVSKAAKMMKVWNSEITFDKMNTTRICTSEINSTDRIGSIKGKRQKTEQTLKAHRGNRCIALLFLKPRRSIIRRNYYSKLSIKHVPIYSSTNMFLCPWSHSDIHTLDRTPLDEESARRRDLYLTTHSIHKRQMSIPPAGFEPTIPAS
jgi:hypothetical protein